MRRRRWTRCTRIRGKKGQKHDDPADPPRRRGNKVRGHGTWDNDRPPVFGAVGRESGQVRLRVLRHSTRAELMPETLGATRPGTCVNSDEWGAYASLPEQDRRHATVCHAPPHPEWARDDDGDGIREVHVNTLEGFWTGLRNYLRPFRGVNKVYLASYVAVYEWTHNESDVFTVLLALLGAFTPFAA